MIHAFADFFLYCLSWLSPRTRHLAVFGSWCGRQYSDNPRYLLEYILEHSKCTCVWIGEAQIEPLLPRHPRLRFARIGSFAANWAALRAKNWFFCQGARLDISPWSLYGGARLYNLWHGLAFKNMGRASHLASAETGVSRLRRLWRFFFKNVLSPKTPYWLPVASRSMARLMCGFAPEWFSADRIIESGTPRNDFLINRKDDKILAASFKEKYAKLLCFDPSKKIVLYMPTFRGKGEEARIGLGDIVSGSDAIVIEKHHPLTFEKNAVEGRVSGGSIIVTPEQASNIVNQELYLAADVMIGDYSSAFMDFALLGKPVVHFVYDLEKFSTKDAGLAYDMYEIAGGPVVKTEGELKTAMGDLLAGKPFSVGRQLPELLEYEKGTACRQLMEHAGIE